MKTTVLLWVLIVLALVGCGAKEPSCQIGRNRCSPIDPQAVEQCIDGEWQFVVSCDKYMPPLACLPFSDSFPNDVTCR